VPVTDRALLIQYSAETVQSVRLALSIAACYIEYVDSLFKQLRSIFGITLSVLYRVHSVANFLLALLYGLYISGISLWWCCGVCDCWQLLHLFNMLLWWFSQAHLYVVILYGLIDQLLWICRSIVYEFCNTLWVIYFCCCYYYQTRIAVNNCHHVSITRPYFWSFELRLFFFKMIYPCRVIKLVNIIQYAVTNNLTVPDIKWIVSAWYKPSAGHFVVKRSHIQGVTGGKDQTSGECSLC